jgi:hypothetical protein
MDCFGFYGLLRYGVFMSRIDIVGQNGNDGLHYDKPSYSPEFIYWYERIYLQSPSLSSLQYDDEKMWEAWKAAKEL